MMYYRWPSNKSRYLHAIVSKVPKSSQHWIKTHLLCITSLIIYDRKFKNGVNIESKTENRGDIGSKLAKRIAKLVNSLIFYVKKTRFATVFDHRKIANS